MGEGALAGLRVVEYGGMVSAAYAAKLMADLGADVIKVEPPGGDAARRRGPFPRGLEGDADASGLYIYLNANKRGVTLDLALDRDREAFERLLDGAGVFVHNLSLRQAGAVRLDDAWVRGGRPRLVHTWITPFGLTGPRAGYEGDELTAVAAGGWLSLSPATAPDATYPPLKAFGRQGDYQAGTTAAMAAMGALFARDQTGEGQLVDVSAQEVIGTEVEVALARWVYAGSMTRHFGGGVVAAPTGPVRCKDGYIFAMTAQPHQWPAFVHMMGDPEWGLDPRLADREERLARAAEIYANIEAWTSERTVEEVFTLAGEARLPFAPISTVGQLINSPHLKARGFFVTVSQPGAGAVTMPGAPYTLSRTPWELRRPAPRLGEHNAEVLASAGGPP